MHWPGGAVSAQPLLQRDNFLNFQIFEVDEFTLNRTMVAWY